MNWLPYATFGMVASGIIGTGGWRIGSAIYRLNTTLLWLGYRVKRIERHLKLDTDETMRPDFDAD